MLEISKYVCLDCGALFDTQGFLYEKYSGVQFPQCTRCYGENLKGFKEISELEQYDFNYECVKLVPDVIYNNYNVILKSIDISDYNNKIRSIGTLRKLNSELSLVDAKYVVEHTPYVIGENVSEEIADIAKKELEKCGCDVELEICD